MTLFRRHDRYVLKAFWASFGAILLFFTVIVIVVHLADRSGRLMRYAPHIREAGYDPVLVTIEYYATLIPFAWNLIIPVSAPIAAARTTARWKSPISLPASRRSQKNSTSPLSSSPS